MIRPKHFTRLLEQAKGTPYEAMIHTLTLRSQMPAVYSPENLGHFGLALQRYAHFTSPIRRYSDLLVHRALITAYDFGEDGLPPDAAATFEATGQHISATERRAAAAERDAIDRYVAHFMSERVGENFDGRINGVARFGLFVTLERDRGGRLAAGRHAAGGFLRPRRAVPRADRPAQWARLPAGGADHRPPRGRPAVDRRVNL